eukprot:1157563-Pelagomonas_calceolata.AAC.1
MDRLAPVDHSTQPPAVYGPSGTCGSMPANAPAVWDCLALLDHPALVDQCQQMHQLFGIVWPFGPSGTNPSCFHQAAHNLHAIVLPSGHCASFKRITHPSMKHSCST